LRLASFFAVGTSVSQLRHAKLLAVGVAIVASACDTPTAADTVDLGDNFEAPELVLDEDFFHCEIQPKVITAYRCSAGDTGDGGGCHAQKSALRLIDVPEQPRCQAGRLIGAPPSESEVNLERARAAVGVDADSSPIYRRPLGLDSHPRMIFDARSEPAVLLRMWLSEGTP
jgi:hypothetical protein